MECKEIPQSIKLPAEENSTNTEYDHCFVWEIPRMTVSEQDDKMAFLCSA